MSAKNPTILALDFDGVLCNGLVEYFQTAWRTYCQIWQPADTVPPGHLAENFYRLRPVIETGWEMPVLIRALLQGKTEEEILQGWQAIAQEVVTAEGRDPKDIANKLDKTRDNWISADLDEWLSLHEFYPGVVAKLQEVIASPTEPIIITTKEGRFARQLLRQQGVDLPAESIIGKESKRPKHQTLRELLAAYGEGTSIWFIEDRMKTLVSANEQPDLVAGKMPILLFLADWGYNTEAERSSAAENPSIQLLSLSQFSEDFSVWLGSESS